MPRTHSWRWQPAPESCSLACTHVLWQIYTCSHTQINKYNKKLKSRQRSSMVVAGDAEHRHWGQSDLQVWGVKLWPWCLLRDNKILIIVFLSPPTVSLSLEQLCWRFSWETQGVFSKFLELGNSASSLCADIGLGSSLGCALSHRLAYIVQ